MKDIKGGLQVHVVTKRHVGCGALFFTWGQSFIDLEEGLDRMLTGTLLCLCDCERGGQRQKGDEREGELHPSYPFEPSVRSQRLRDRRQECSDNEEHPSA